MKINIGSGCLEITLTNNSVYYRIDKLIKSGKYALAIKELRDHRMANGGDYGLKVCKEFVDNRKVELMVNKIVKDIFP